MGETKPKVIIIGGGISGIALGDHLSRNGFTDFVILEASGRTGGRIYTINIGKSNFEKMCVMVSFRDTLFSSAGTNLSFYELESVVFFN